MYLQHVCKDDEKKICIKKAEHIGYFKVNEGIFLHFKPLALLTYHQKE